MIRTSLALIVILGCLVVAGLAFGPWNRSQPVAAQPDPRSAAVVGGVVASATSDPGRSVVLDTLRPAAAAAPSAKPVAAKGATGATPRFEVAYLHATCRSGCSMDLEDAARQTVTAALARMGVTDLPWEAIDIEEQPDTPYASATGADLLPGS